MMLTAAAQAKVLVFTGAPGSGAQDAARTLADSLGWPEAKLVEEPAEPGKE